MGYLGSDASIQIYRRDVFLSVGDRIFASITSGDTVLGVKDHTFVLIVLSGTVSFDTGSLGVTMSGGFFFILAARYGKCVCLMANRAI